jgi:hypothetical protein
MDIYDMYNESNVCNEHDIDKTVEKIYNIISACSIESNQIISDRKMFSIYKQIIDIAKADNKFVKLADEYCESRDLLNVSICKTVDEVYAYLFKMSNEIKGITRVKLMSSCGEARTNLIGSSDIDFGILCNLSDVHTIGLCKNMLMEQGYLYDNSMNDYYVFKKMHGDIIIEIKLRDTIKTEKILRLHNLLEILDKKLQNIITYIKYILHTKFDSSKQYDKFKSLVYSAYYSRLV